MLSLVAVFVGGGAGSCCRYLLSKVINEKCVPLGTFVVNVLGCFIFGVLVSMFLHHSITQTSKLLLLSGFCGGFTTFSTFCSETGYLLDGNGKNIIYGFIYPTLSIVVGIISMYIGLRIPTVFS